MSAAVTLFTASPARRPRQEDALARIEREAGFRIEEVEIALSVAPDRRWEVYPQILVIEESVALNKAQLRKIAELPTAEDIEQVASAAADTMAISTEVVVRRELSNLIGAFPNASPADPATYVTALTFDILDMGIPDAVLVVACRQIRRTQKFVPTISELLETASAITARWNSLKPLSEKRRIVTRHYEAVVAQGEEKLAKAKAEREIEAERDAQKERTLPKFAIKTMGAA